MRKALYASTLTLIWLAVAVIVLYTLGSVYFYKLYATPSVSYRDVHVVEKVLQNGSVLTLSIDRCAAGAFPYTARRELQNGVIYLLPKSDGVTSKGCKQYSRIVFTIPPELPPGEYHLNVSLDFTVRWLFFSRIDTREFTTNAFTIVANDHD